jgi:hypothetical protein
MTDFWRQSDPIRDASNYDSVLVEIESRMPTQHIYRDNDKITHAHETTHGLNSRLRNAAGANMNAAYFTKTNGMYFCMGEPNGITLTQIASKIPNDMRDSTYQLYLVDQARSWNNQPLYMVDELSAYYNGSLYGIDVRYQNLGVRVQGSIANTMKFLYYTVVLCELLRTTTPSFMGVMDDIGRLLRTQLVGPAYNAGCWNEQSDNLWERCVQYIKTLKSGR